MHLESHFSECPPAWQHSDTVALIGGAGSDFVQEDNVLRTFSGRHMNVDDIWERLF